ncbi:MULTISPECIES: bifunctional glutamate N-acetyltransferase/amino-acid acetyltransferase ArgJ [Acidithrix]|uniref:Arginine biosynthesis bifunctional protein ArgJ n=1 Tax=Acidithrix ferrooxidans TaxID=1280514 RepID=A0A0D8HFL3_9ACTN|nr:MULTISPECIES: bifunctional glutamate N-acetyltransferase/amino-acid acetyltransferase ArgJ [Acidithrix]KJF16582.1 arginine biosynthesis bifunctional protein ArgJ [Acidithrix ferrooxidans]CAG4930954.1 unnamed protein product [Acidithrix sp. C25]
MSVTFPGGFRASGVSAGIKESNKADMALVVSEDCRPYVSAGTFTTNLSAAAPVKLSKANLALSKGEMVGVLLTSGNANAATGKRGDEAAKRSLERLGELLGVDPTSLMVASTGLIGIQMPVEKLIGGLEGAVDSLGATLQDGTLAAEAMMTTDTFAKTSTYEINGVKFGGIAKGAAMIAPNMATMLAMVTTDAQVNRDDLAEGLFRAVDATFNRITIDGCTSTNDSVFVMASGKSGRSLSAGELYQGLYSICYDLARQIVFDAEGATKLIEVAVTKAASVDDALAVARKIAESSLVKCSFFGEDPYWGRIISEVGTAGVDLDIDRVTIRYGGIMLYSDGEEILVDPSTTAAVMALREIHLEVDLSCGIESASIITADLSPAYIAENMRTS